MSEPHTVSEPEKYLFLVMDGRSNYDFSVAVCIEAIPPQANYERYFLSFKEDYEGYDYCLFALPVNEASQYGKPIRIASLKDLEQL